MENLVELLDNLKDGYSFEEYIANLLELLDYEKVTVTNFSGDYGIDVLAEKDGIKYAIQCKYYSEPVGNKSIQEAFAGKSFYNCHIAIVATNNFFTENAKKLANDIGVVLWDKYSILKLINTIMKNPKNIQKNHNSNNNSNDDINIELLDRVVNLLFEYNQVSIAFLQRSLNLGYAKSGYILDKLEELKVISAYNGAIPRKLLITKDEWENIKKTL